MNKKDANALKQVWRRRNPKITQLWRGDEQAELLRVLLLRAACVLAAIGYFVIMIAMYCESTGGRACLGQ